MSKVNLTQWAKNNAVVLVMVPLIVVIHWGWYKLQSMPHLVPPSEKRTEMPLTSALKVYKNRFFGNIGESSKDASE